MVMHIILCLRKIAFFYLLMLSTTSAFTIQVVYSVAGDFQFPNKTNKNRPAEAWKNASEATILASEWPSHCFLAAINRNQTMLNSKLSLPTIFPSRLNSWGLQLAYNLVVQPVTKNCWNLSQIPNKRQKNILVAHGYLQYPSVFSSTSFRFYI